MRIYVAGPYTQGDPCINTKNAIDIANQLVEKGHTPFIPHLAHFWHTISPKSYEFWTSYDIVWLEQCDAVYRMEGASAGADYEVKLAREIGLPIYYSMSEVRQPQTQLEQWLNR